MSTVTIGSETMNTRVKGSGLFSVVALFKGLSGRGSAKSMARAERATPVAVIHSKMSSQRNSGIAYECDSWLSWMRK